MRARVFFLNRLRDGVDASAYEKFVKEVDYPRASGVPTILDYSVYRVRGLEAEPSSFSYIETVDVSDYDEYRSQLTERPGRQEFISELRSLVDAIALVGERVTPDPQDSDRPLGR